MTAAQQKGWLGIGGLAALAGLGWLISGRTVRNPRPLFRSIWPPDGEEPLPCGHRGPADDNGWCPTCARLQESEDDDPAEEAARRPRRRRNPRTAELRKELQIARLREKARAAYAAVVALEEKYEDEPGGAELDRLRAKYFRLEDQLRAAGGGSSRPSEAELLRALRREFAATRR